MNDIETLIFLLRSSVEKTQRARRGRTEKTLVCSVVGNGAVQPSGLCVNRMSTEARAYIADLQRGDA